MAIEDAYEMAKILSLDIEARQASGKAWTPLDLQYEKLLRSYKNERLIRAGAIHGMARMAAIAASTYKAYLGEQWKCVLAVCFTLQLCARSHTSPGALLMPTQRSQSGLGVIKACACSTASSQQE